MAEDGARDERLGGLLGVEPLDEVTRRRLVTTALRASAPPGRSRRWIAAAAVVVGLVIGVGVALLATGGDDTGAPTASQQKSATPNTTPPAASPSSSATEAVVPTDAGDFGDLSEAGNLARARAALGAAPIRGEVGAADAASPAAGATLERRFDTFACSDELDEGTVVATATGRFGNREAVVVAIERPDGTRTIEAIVADPCEVRPLD
jgi:hypothetical protein